MGQLIARNLLNILLVGIILAIIISNFFFVRLAFDLIVVVLALIAIILRKQKAFFKDWWWPIVLFYVYEFVRGRAYSAAQFFGFSVWDLQLVALERAVFPFLRDVPTVVLQYAWSDPLSTVFQPHWYDFMLFFLYTSFFWFWLVTSPRVGRFALMKRRQSKAQ